MILDVIKIITGWDFTHTRPLPEITPHTLTIQ